MNNINEILIKIKKMDYDKETCIAELISYNPESNFVEPMEQMKLLRQVRALAEENNIFLEENKEEKGGLGFYVKFKKIKNNNDLIVNEIVNFIEKMNDGDTNSIHNIYNKIANNENEKIDLFVIQQKVERICENKGIILDYSAYDGQMVGVPYSLEFVKKIVKKDECIDSEFKINNNISFEDEETKIEYQKYLDEVNEYNRKVANGETPEKDLSTIISEFKDKFVINGNEGESQIEDNKLNSLIEKFNKNLDNGIGLNDINEKTEELNMEENNVFVDYTKMNAEKIKLIIKNQAILLQDKFDGKITKSEETNEGLIFWNCKMILKNIMMASNKLISKYSDELSKDEIENYKNINVTIENDVNRWNNIELVKLTFTKIKGIVLNNNTISNNSIENNESKVSIKCPKCGNLIQENCKDVPSNIMKLDTICSNCGTNIMFKNPNYKD